MPPRKRLTIFPRKDDAFVQEQSRLCEILAIPTLPPIWQTVCSHLSTRAATLEILGLSSRWQQVSAWPDRIKLEYTCTCCNWEYIDLLQVGN